MGSKLFNFLLNSLMELPETFCLFDTEYTAWEGSQETKWSKYGEEKELIQLSALLLRKCKNHIFIVDQLNLFVKPKKNPKLSNYIIKLTGITNKKLFENGISFDEAMNKFYKFSTFSDTKIKIYSYGNDYSIIKENLNLNKYDKNHKYYDWETSFFDLKHILEKYNIPTSDYTSGTLYKYFNISETADVHNSEWDVLSMYYSLCKLLEIYS